jgi:glycosidase
VVLIADGERVEPVLEDVPAPRRARLPEPRLREPRPGTVPGSTPARRVCPDKRACGIALGNRGNPFYNSPVRWRVPLCSVALGALLTIGVAASGAAAPTSVTIAGSLQSELGCSGDWQPDCVATHLLYDGSDDVWQRTFSVPAGSWEYKAPLNDSWDENYGQNAQPGGANIPLSLASTTSVKFYYDHKTHWVTDNHNSVIAVSPGSFQSELGCPGDWDPGCLRSWLEDPDGDGIYTYETTAHAQGSYEGKVALNESWDVNYGQGGVQNGSNIPFTVPVDGAKVVFRYDSSTHVLTIEAGHAHDGNVEWDGLRHDSRSTLYRSPGGAVPAGTPVKIRFRTFHDDVTSVKLRLFDVNANAQRIVAMARVASDVSCYQSSLAAESCDYWQATLANAAANNLWYRFVVSDGSKTAYYADDTSALDGGLGAPSDDARDWSWALTVYVPGFQTPAWARNAVIYQIFPDRFRNGVPGNDPVPGGKTGPSKDPRYAYPNGDPSNAANDPAWDRITEMSWSELPEGYCRNYAGATALTCPRRFPEPGNAATLEGPRGRDYYGGDLPGITKQLDYLKGLGVTAIYLNPIFDSASNHGYDTRDYLKVNPYFGTLEQFKDLVAAAKARGIRVILDGVFNHMSSDSPFFDRYHHYSQTGACESTASPWRDWFSFHTPSTPCGSADYDGWFGFDSIPVLSKSRADVQSYFLTAPNSVTRYWLQQGAAGWRLDVSGDASFPSGYWESFRNVVKAADPNALTISETWQKDTSLLRILRGDRLDTTMNYRLRDAVLGFLAPNPFDPKGFPDSGNTLAPSQVAARLASIYEDYAPGAANDLMNLLDSHDTARLLWTLTQGADNRAGRELDAAALTAGKQRLRLASLIQFGVPGAPTVYYGDEVGLTGGDDPDNRRTYPWADLGGTADATLRSHYQALGALRRDVPALATGDFRILRADDGAGTLAFGRKTSSQAAIVVANRSGSPQTVDVPVAGYLPDGISLSYRYGGSGNATVSGGVLHVDVGATAGALLASGTVDLEPPAAPAGLHVTSEGNARVGLEWNGVAGAASYDVFRSPVSGGGYVKANGAPVTGTSFTDTGLANAQTYFFVVRAVDSAGNASGDSNEVSALPHLTIGWANLQWPPSMSHTISAVNRTDNAYGQVWIDGETSKPGPTPTLQAELGFGPHSSNPVGNGAWTWTDASFNTDSGNNDEFVASMLPEAVGTYDYVYRYSTTNGRDWLYADRNGPIGNTSAPPPNPGVLTVDPSSDTSAPAAPTGLHVVTASPVGIELAWNAVGGDPTLYGYEVLRSASSGGPYTRLDRITGTDYVDADVIEGSTYYYVVRSVDTSFNRSGNSAETSATAQLRTVHLVFNVTVPATTDATGRSVHIAGFLDRLDGGYPQWDPGATPLTRVDATHWTIDFTGKEGTQIEYKFTLGDWDHVEKDGGCGETANRQLTLSYGSGGTQNASETVQNWRNVAPCGN